MIAVDTNVLVYAHREELPHHEMSLRCITQLAENNPPWGITVFSIGEFLHIVTHPRVFDPPSSLKQSTTAIQNILLSPSVRILIPGESYVQYLTYVNVSTQETHVATLFLTRRSQQYVTHTAFEK